MTPIVRCVETICKVTILNSERIGMLDGGGEESAAYILLYRSKPLS
jgi:ubiquitin carboxyl-terminal hydrolase 14